MSRSISGPRSDRPTGALRPQIYYYEDHVTIRIDRNDWDEGLEKHAKSANTSVDKAARAAWKASEDSDPVDGSGAVKQTHPALQSDPRDEIPLIYCNTTRRIISAVGCLLSAGAITAITIAGNHGDVAGFKELPVNEYEPKGDSDLFIGTFGAAFAVAVTAFGCLFANTCKK